METLTHVPLRKWIVFTSIGWLSGIILILLFSGILESFGISGMQFNLGLGMGCGIGFFQWLLLRKWVNTPFPYFIFTALGMGLPFLLLDLISNLEQEWNMLGGTITGGACAAYLQSTLFPNSHFQRLKWILFSMLGWLASLGCILLITYTNAFKSESSNLLLLALINLTLILIGGPIMGFITGKVLQNTSIHGLKS